MSVKTDIFIKDRADPYIIKGSDGYYYFTASYPMYGKDDAEGYDRIILRRSKTIDGLRDAEEKVIWDEKESDAAFRFIWAPEIHEIGGKWYVLFAASGSGIHNSRDRGEICFHGACRCSIAASRSQTPFFPAADP